MFHCAHIFQLSLIANKSAWAEFGKQEAVYLQRIEHDRLLLCIMSLGNNHDFANTPSELFEAAARIDLQFSFLRDESQRLIDEAFSISEALTVAKCKLDPCVAVDFTSVKTPCNLVCMGDARMTVNPR